MNTATRPGVEERELEVSDVNEADLDTASDACAESAFTAARSVGLVEIREYLVLRFDGTTVRFPVRDGDVAQARLRAALTQRPEDCVVAVTDGAYIRVGSESALDTHVAADV